MEGHAKKCVERYCELAHKTTQQLHKVATPFIHDHQLKEEKNESVVELSTVCSQIVLKCLYFARIGRLDTLWSVNKLVRVWTKLTKACDKCLARLISYIHHISEYRQYCYVGNTAQQCRLGLFRDSDFAGDLEDWKSTSGGVLCIFRKSHLCTDQWDVQETDLGLTQLNRSWGNFSRCRFTFTHGWDSRFRSLGFSDWSSSFLTTPNPQKQRCKRATKKLVGNSSVKHAKTKFQPSTSICIWPTLITFHQTEHILVPLLCCMFWG